ncbi:MAG: hypothetical protein V2I43_04010 [Parvularcula sp.]|jgi:hypothetical protein|nr:hypothetical protein [Parvularcula sp.]
MKRLLLILALTACSSNETAISSMNFLLEPMDPECAVASVDAIEGYELRDVQIAERRSIATFDAGPVPDLKLIVSNPRRGASEASVFVYPEADADPLQRRIARMAVRAADEAIYVNCTVDGRSDDRSTVIVESQKE